MRKKILSEILILVMLVSILPTSDVNAISTEETPLGSVLFRGLWMRL